MMHAGREIERRRRRGSSPFRRGRWRRGWRRPQHADRAEAVGDRCRRTAAPRPRAGSEWRWRRRRSRGPSPARTTSACRNWPIAERGPKAISAIAQPTAIRTTGVRQSSFNGAGAAAVDMRLSGMIRAGSARQEAAYLVARPRRPKRKFVMDSICARAWLHGWAAGMRGLAKRPVEVLYDLLEVRISGLEMPAESRMFSSPIYAQIEHIRQRWRLRCRFWKPSVRSRRGRRRAAAAPGNSALRRFGALPDAVAGMERRGRARHRASLRAHQECRALGRMAVLRALCPRHQRGEEGAQRRHPGAQLPDAGDLPLRRRFRRRLAAARARGHQGQSRRDRAGRRALHGRDREDPESRTRPC